MPAWKRTMLLGVIVPGLAYSSWHFTAPPRTAESHTRGLDLATIDLDTLSPSRAQELGLRSRLPATEVVVFVISAQFCAASQREPVRSSIAAVPDLVRLQLAEHPESVARVVGVSVDPDVGVGFAYMSQLASFDEIIAGTGWLNTATEKLFYGPYARPSATPQVIVMERRVIWEASGAVIEDERLVQSIVGAPRIIEWVESGAPVSGSTDL